MNKENKKLQYELEDLVNKFRSEIKKKYKERIKLGNFTKQENPESHFCSYFVAYDSDNKKIYIGHHKKSGLWLVNGGHIDKGEGIRESVKREIYEEWGINPDELNIKEPELLTITEINNPTKQTCRFHYDIWFFVKTNKDNFEPDKNKVLIEFHEIGWFSPKEARKIVKDKNTLIGIDFIEKNYFNQ